jgi:hypothetical protein
VRTKNSIIYKILDEFLGERDHDSKPSHNLFFDCVNDSERLKMSFTLYRDGQKLFSRGPELHWWLTGFKWGVYSNPDQLRMDLTIEFPNPDMQKAFVDALKSMGYNNVQENSNKVSFIFDQPKTTPQPRAGNPLLGPVNEANQNIVKTYTAFHFKNNDPNNIPPHAFEVILGSILKYEHFFGRILSHAIGDLGKWLETMSFLIKIMDFSCAVEVVNNSNEDYVLDSSDAVHGHYLAPPPPEIPKGTNAKIWIQDYPGPAGSEGKVVYRGKNSGQKVPLIFRCTTVSGPNNSNANLCSGTNEFYTKSGKASNNWLSKNKIQQSGHPFFVRFILQNNNGNEFRKEGNSLVAVNGTALKVGEYVTINGSNNLSGSLTDKDNAKVYSIKLEKSSNPAYAYVLTIDGQGPKAGLKPWKAAETLVLYFYDGNGEKYLETIWDSDRKTHVLRYSSDAPYIGKVTWEVKG